MDENDEKIDSDDPNSKDANWKGCIQLDDDEECPQSSETSYEPISISTPSGGRHREAIYGWRQNIVRLTCAHTHAFRHQMRPKCSMDGINTAERDRDRFLTPNEQKQLLHCRNVANSILFMASKILGKAHKENLIDTYSMIHAQKTIDSLCEIQTACERIYNTSLPLAYSLLVYRTTTIYVALVPFAIAETTGWWTP